MGIKRYKKTSQGIFEWVRTVNPKGINHPLLGRMSSIEYKWKRR
tara:strand:- start:98 stop:229 length:132 start_codon:yes stop_codon:yes gene_type:complete